MLFKRTAYALVAQLDRVFGYEPKGQGFESLRAHQKIPLTPVGGIFVFLPIIHDKTPKRERKVIMSSNEEQIRALYADGEREESRAAQSRSAGMEFAYTMKTMEKHIQKTDRVLEVGCATGYYALRLAPLCREYVGVDLVPAHIDRLRENVRAAGLTNATGRVGDATQLGEIPDDSFDVVCCFGPLYHLPPEERELVFAECRRVCRPGGVLAFAYICQIGVYAAACVHDTLRQFYPSKRANEYVLGRGTDDFKPGVFFYTTPEEMEAAAKRHGLTKVSNLGLDFFLAASVIDAMSEETFALYQPLADRMCASEACTGMSNHALLVCRKEAGG